MAEYVFVNVLCEGHSPKAWWSFFLACAHVGESLWRFIRDQNIELLARLEWVTKKIYIYSALAIQTYEIMSRNQVKLVRMKKLDH